MLLSTAYNKPQTVLSNLYHCFTEVAQKSYHYARSLPNAKQPSSRLLISKCSLSFFWSFDYLLISVIAPIARNGQLTSFATLETLNDLIKLACVLMKRRKRTSKDILPYECCITNSQARW